MTTIREMTIEDHEQIIELWSKIDGLVLSEADAKMNIDTFLKRNKGLSYICEDNNAIIGTILCGHDGLGKKKWIFYLFKDYVNIPR